MPRHWTIPRIWEGRTVAVLASGESMSQAAANKVQDAGIPAIAINTTFRLAPWADILYAADAAWWLHNPDALKFAGLKVTMEDVQGVLKIQRAGNIGYTDDPMTLFTFGQSGAQAIQIAAKAGAKRILVLGMDMTGGHWHGAHPAPLRNTSEELHDIFRDRMPTLARALGQRGIEVLNCSKVSKLDVWPKVTLDEALARAEHAQ